MSKSFTKNKKYLFGLDSLNILLSLFGILFLTACSGGGESNATCTDGIKNQNETDTDCGGICATCENSKNCLVDKDCTSNHCESGTCESYASETCTDQKKNQDETDTDCGGSVCDACTIGKSCLRYTDCESGFCDNGTCKSGDVDQCPDDPDKTEPGQCGCGVADTDSDSDGTADCNDNCPDDADKTEVGQCGCGVVDTDSDSDGTADCNDQCPDDADKIEPGVCGCGVTEDDTDTDLDGTADCIDGCVDDPNKVDPGLCGCGVVDDDTDTDLDGTADCVDGCVDDPDKIDPGVCGCGVPDLDENQNGSPDCIEDCTGEPNGSAEIDKCGRCTGGNTGLEACPLVVLEPIADSYVSSNDPDTNFGLEDDLEVQRNKESMTFMKFDLSQLPPGAFIKSVTLNATTYCGFAHGGDGNVYTRLVDDDTWEEESITWNNMPVVDEEHDLGYWWIWYDNNCADAPKVGTNSAPALLHAVQAEADSDDTISLRLDSNGYDTSYYSREHEDAADRPTLEIAYLEPKVLVLEPVADAEVASNRPDDNYGDSDQIRVDRTNLMSFLRFDLTSIPQDADIRAVTLRAVSFDGNAWGGDGNVYTLPVADDTWGEDTITWNNMPFADDENMLGYWWIWYDHGANAPKVGTNSDPALADAVKSEWANDGLISLRLNSPGYWTSYYSREYATAEDRPQLIVYYYDSVSIELDPVADSYVLTNSPDSSYGVLDSLRIDPNGRSQVFLRFDLSSLVIPLDAALARVSLKAVSFDGHAYGGNGNVYTRLVTDDSWDEKGITWNNMPPAEEDDLGYWWIWYNNGANAPKTGINSDPKLMDAVLNQIADDGVVSFMLYCPGYRTEYYSREDPEPANHPKLIFTMYLP